MEISFFIEEYVCVFYHGKHTLFSWKTQPLKHLVFDYFIQNIVFFFFSPSQQALQQKKGGKRKKKKVSELEQEKDKMIPRFKTPLGVCNCLMQRGIKKCKTLKKRNAKP